MLVLLPSIKIHFILSFTVYFGCITFTTVILLSTNVSLGIGDFLFYVRGMKKSKKSNMKEIKTIFSLFFQAD